MAQARAPGRGRRRDLALSRPANDGLEAPLRQTLERVVLWWALLGGVGLLLIVGATAFNVGAFAADMVARRFGASVHAFPGYEDFVRLTVSAAVLMLFPYCQLRRGHVAVDLLVERMPQCGPARDRRDLADRHDPAGPVPALLDGDRHGRDARRPRRLARARLAGVAVLSAGAGLAGALGAGRCRRCRPAPCGACARDDRARDRRDRRSGRPFRSADAAHSGRPDHDRGRHRRLVRAEPRGAASALRALSPAVQDAAVEHGRQLRPFGRAAVRAHGLPRRARQSLARPVPGRQRADRPASGRRRDGGGRRLRGLRRGVRLLARDRLDHGPGGAARAQAHALRGQLRDRHARGRRHARHPDPAFGAARDLRDHRRGVDHRDVPGGDRARPDRGRRVHRGDRAAGPAAAGPRADRRADVG